MRLPKGASGGQSGVAKAATSRTIAVFGQLSPFFLTWYGLPAARNGLPWVAGGYCRALRSGPNPPSSPMLFRPMLPATTPAP